MRTFRQPHKSVHSSSVSDTFLCTSRKTILTHTRWCITSLIAPLEVDGLFMHIVCFQCIVLHLSSYLWKEHGYWYSWLFGRHWAILMNHSQMLGLINTLLSGNVQLSCKFLFFFPFNFSTCHKFEGPRCYLELVFLEHNRHVHHLWYEFNKLSSEDQWGIEWVFLLLLLSQHGYFPSHDMLTYCSKH